MKTATKSAKSRRPRRPGHTDVDTLRDLCRISVLTLYVGNACRYGGDRRLLEDNARDLARLLRRERLGR